jgi:hypothetical protein
MAVRGKLILEFEASATSPDSGVICSPLQSASALYQTSENARLQFRSTTRMFHEMFQDSTDSKTGDNVIARQIVAQFLRLPVNVTWVGLGTHPRCYAMS